MFVFVCCLVGLLICPTLKPLSYIWRILYHMHLAGGQIFSPIIEGMTARYLLSQSPLTARYAHMIQTQSIRYILPELRIRHLGCKEAGTMENSFW